MPLNSHDIDRMVTSYREDYSPDVAAGLVKVRERLGQLPSLTVVKRPGGRRRLLLPAAAAAVVLLVLSIFYFGNDSSVHLIADGNNLAEYRLPDGSEIVLQSGSEVTYDADDFNGIDRRLTLSGQAYFEVVPDKDRPFLINNGSTELRVTGTAFNLRADAELMEVEVSEGAVLLSRGSTKLAVAAKQCGLSEAGQPLLNRPAPNLNHHAWRTGRLTFERTPVAEVLSYFEANWDIRCSWGGNLACDYPVSGNYEGAEAADVLADVARLGGLTLRQDENDPKHFIFDGSCAE